MKSLPKDAELFRWLWAVCLGILVLVAAIVFLSGCEKAPTYENRPVVGVEAGIMVTIDVNDADSIPEVLLEILEQQLIALIDERIEAVLSEDLWAIDVNDGVLELDLNEKVTARQFKQYFPDANWMPEDMENWWASQKTALASILLEQRVKVLEAKAEQPAGEDLQFGSGPALTLSPHSGTGDALGTPKEWQSTGKGWCSGSPSAGSYTLEDLNRIYKDEPALGRLAKRLYGFEAEPEQPSEELTDFQKTTLTADIGLGDMTITDVDFSALTTIDYESADIADEFVKSLAKRGRICEVLGHQWGEPTRRFSHSQLDIIVTHLDKQMRQCQMCGEKQFKQKQPYWSDWKEDSE